MNPEFIKTRIAQLLASRRISEYRVSMDLGHSKSYLQKVTSGKALPSLSALIELCDYFDITLSEFFHDPDAEPFSIHRKPVRELLEYAVKLDDSDIEILLTFVRSFRIPKNGQASQTKTSHETSHK